jgi:hypothetical protein
MRLFDDFLRLVRDRHARLVAAWFFFILAIFLGLGYMYVVNAGFGFFGHGCASGFSQGRIAALLMLTPIAFALTLASVGEAIRWMEARRRGYGYKLNFFWKMTGLGGVLLLAAFLLGRC